MGNSSPKPTPPTSSSSAADASAVQIDVGGYYHYKGRTGVGLNEETGDCQVSAKGSQPNTWNIKMLVSNRSYTGCPTSLFSKPMMESSGRGRRPSTASSSSSSSSSSKSPGYSVTASGSSASVMSSKSSTVQIDKKRKQPAAVPTSHSSIVTISGQTNPTLPLVSP